MSGRERVETSPSHRAYSEFIRAAHTFEEAGKVLQGRA